MVKLKSAVIAGMMFVAVGAMASNFRAADQVYIPVAGHVAGASGTFISDMFLSNMSADAVSVSVIYVQTGVSATPVQQNFNNVITLQPNERKEYIDFFISGLGQSCTGTQVCFGQLILNACKQGGDCNVSTCPGGSSGACPDFRNISAETRIYSIPAGTTLTSTPPPPTLGQDFAGIPWYNFVSSDAAPVGLDKIEITGLRNTGGAGTAGTYRGNIGLVNASQFSTTTLIVKLFNGANSAQIGSNATVTLGPLGHTQQNVSALFPSFTGATATNAYVTVEQSNTVPTGDAAAAGCPNGCPAFFAYGSVLDNASGDPTTLESQYLKPLTDAAINCIYNSACKGAFNLHRAVKH